MQTGVKDAYWVHTPEDSVQFGGLLPKNVIGGEILAKNLPAGVVRTEIKDESPDDLDIKIAENQRFMDKVLEIKRRNKVPSFKPIEFTPNELDSLIDGYFSHCAEKSLMPTEPMLALWLGISKARLKEIRINPSKYGDLTEIVNTAYDMMETANLTQIYDHAQGAIFLSKSVFGHTDTQNVNVKIDMASADEVMQAIANLGFDVDENIIDVE
jgi:hypothetical protein